MLPRASSSAVSVTARSRFSRIIRIACRAQASKCGFHSVDVTASIACVSASIPVAAAIGAGRVAVASGSRIARSKKTGKSRIRNLMWRSESLITATGLASEPVPAVVGIAADGASGSGLPSPSSSRGRM